MDAGLAGVTRHPVELVAAFSGSGQSSTRIERPPEERSSRR